MHSDRPVLALMLRLLSALMFSTMFLGVKYAATRGISLVEIMFWRQASSLPLICAWLAVIGGIHQLKPQRFARHALRGITGTVGMVFGFTAVTLLPLAESTTIGFTAPFFAVILTALVLREHVGVWRWTAVAAGFIGVLVITRPGSGGEVSMLGLAAGLGAALIVALVSFQIREMTRTETPFAIVFYFSVFGTVLVAPFLPFAMEPHDIADWLLLLSTGVFGTLGQLLVSLSLRHGVVASVIVMDYTMLIWATLFGWLVWNHLPPLATWLGAPMIIAAGAIVVWREHRLSRETARLAAIDVN